MNPRSETYIQNLIKYFEGKPPGRYEPFDVRMDLGISSHSWRWFSTRYLYPEGTKARALLKRIGVDIETVLRTSRHRTSRVTGKPSRETYLASVFVVANGQ